MAWEGVSSDEFTKKIPILASLCLLSACTSTLLSDERLISKTAEVLRVPRGNLRLVDRLSAGGDTSYSVQTKDGVKYACTITGGDLTSRIYRPADNSDAPDRIKRPSRSQ